MGKVRIAQVLARAGLHLGATTVGRMLQTEPVPEEAAASGEIGILETRPVTALHPDEIRHIDLTTVPTAAGFWVPWLPFTWPQAWPFCWWVAAVVDHFSRAVVGFAVFFRLPTSLGFQRSLGLAIQRACQDAPSWGHQFCSIMGPEERAERPVRRLPRIGRGVDRFFSGRCEPGRVC